MRIALSAVAAVSGVVLLALALYGQPAVYLHQARERWDALMDRPPGDLAADPDNDAGQDRAATLQREVLRLKEELAARRTLEQQSASKTSTSLQPAPMASASSAPVALGLSPRQPSSVLSAANPPGLTTPLPGSSGLAKPIPFELSQSDPSALTLTEAPTSTPRITTLPTSMSPSAPGPAASILAVPPSPPATEAGRIPTPKPDDRRTPPQAGPRMGTPSPQPPSVTTAERREPGGEAMPFKPDAGVPARTEVSKFEAGKPVPPKPSVFKPIVLNPPSPSQSSQTEANSPQPSPSSPRSDGDNAQAILSRIRQSTPDPASRPSGVPPQQASVVQQSVPPQQAALPQQIDGRQTPESRPRSASTSLPRLNAARAAVAGGRLDEARRLLQEAQLQLVFRPLDAAADDPPSAGRGAADVARALEALSANDVPTIRQYIDIAIDDLSGSKTNAPIQDSGRRASGYAPAYPPR